MKFSASGSPILGLNFEEIRTEFLGYDSCFGPLAKDSETMNEVVMRVGVRSRDKEAVERFSKEIAPLILTGPPAVTGFAAGRPKPSEVIAYWPALIPKSAVSAQSHRGTTLKIQLVQIAHARSGDKGDTGNVGVIAREAGILSSP